MGELIIPKTADRPIRGIYSPELHKLVEKLGKVHLARASHVEPGSNLGTNAVQWLADNHLVRIVPKDGTVAVVLPVGTPSIDNLWWADCMPVGGPVLGPFPDRDKALAAEVAWLKENNIPVCDACRTQIEPPKSDILTEADLSAIDDETA